MQTVSKAPYEVLRTRTPNAFLPEVIWIPGVVPYVYLGTPLAMVETMAASMCEDELSIRETIEYLTYGLAVNRKVVIGLPSVASDDDLARLFIWALLDTGIAQTMAVT